MPAAHAAAAAAAFAAVGTATPPSSAVREPLLSAVDGEEARSNRRRQQGEHGTCTSSASTGAAGADVGAAFVRRTAQLLLIAGPRPALLLPVLAAAEAGISARAGGVAGRFYRIFVDGRRDELGPALAAAAALYAAAAALTAGRAAFRDWLAARWRRALALRVQRAYCCGDVPAASLGAEDDPSHAALLSSSAAAAAAAGRGGGGRRGKPSESTPARLPKLGPLAPPYYAARGRLDGPDQRACQDLGLLASALAEVLSALSATPVGVSLYTVLAARAFGGWVPVAAAVAFFAAGAALQRLLMRPVARLVFAQEAAEGALRSAHARLAASAEEAAAWRAGADERRVLDARLEAAYRAQLRLVRRRLALRLLTGCLDYGGALLNYACLAAAVFGGAWGDGGDGGGGGGGEGGSSGGDGGGSSAGGRAARVSVASFYLLMLVSSWTQVLDLAERTADLAGLSARVWQLLEFCGGSGGGGSGGCGVSGGVGGDRGGGGCNGDTGDNDDEVDGCRVGLGVDAAAPTPLVLSVRGLDVTAATGAPVVRGLDLQLRPGGSLLVTGPTGAGKSTLLRVLSGLWAAGGGAVAMAPPGRVVFAPQRPLAAPPGPLRAQLAYGNDGGNDCIHDDRRLLALLREVGLESFAASAADLDAWRDWESALSPGELQRLAFARVLLASPALAVLDEPTSALPGGEAARLFGLLAARGVAYLSVGHRLELADVHERELRIAGGGAWEIVDLR